MPRRALLILLAAGSVGLRCAQNSETARLDEPITPPGTVEREPYLVTVTDSSAVIRWTTYDEERPGIRFWTDEADTTSLELPEAGRSHTFEMIDLAPATEYTYEIQINDTLWSEAAAFQTFPEPGAKEPFTFLVFGDSGTLSDGQLAVAEVLNEEEAAFAIHVGDLAYPDGTPEEYTRKHFAVYAPLFKRVPLYPSAGDHDWRTRQGEVFAEIFTPPGGRDSGNPFYYTFTHGNARFIALDTEDEEWHARLYGYLADPSSEQYQWLLRQLSAARADPGIDWIVVYFHHAPYSASTGFGGHGSSLPIRRAVSPLMDGYGVPLVFSGHDHDYQRSRPIRGNQVAEDDEGTVYVVTGGGGGRTLFRGTGADWFTAHADQVFQFVRVTIDHYDLRLEAVNANGDVFDSYEMSVPESRRKPYVRDALPVAMPDPADAQGAESATGATSTP